MNILSRRNSSRSFFPTNFLKKLEPKKLYATDYSSTREPLTPGKKASGFIQRTNKNSAGFTLIELLVVIAIIGLLASVILVSAASARARGRDAKRLGDLNQFAKALELYFNDNYGYPTATSGGVYVGTGVLLNAQDLQGMVPKYIIQMPTAPEPPDGSCSDTNLAYPSLDNLYWYQSNNPGGGKPASNYTITFCLGATTGDTSLGPGAHYIVNGSLH